MNNPKVEINDFIYNSINRNNILGNKFSPKYKMHVLRAVQRCSKNERSKELEEISFL